MPKGTGECQYFETASEKFNNDKFGNFEWSQIKHWLRLQVFFLAIGLFVSVNKLRANQSLSRFGKKTNRMSLKKIGSVKQRQDFLKMFQKDAFRCQIRYKKNSGVHIFSVFSFFFTKSSSGRPLVLRFFLPFVGFPNLLASELQVEFNCFQNLQRFFWY